MVSECAGPEQRIGDGDQLSGDGGDDDLVRFSGLAEAICEGSQTWVMMCYDQGRLERHMPQGTAPTCDCPFPAKYSAVTRDRSQSGECCRFFAGNGADLRHFGDPHCAGNRTNPRDRAEDDGHRAQMIFARDGPVDPVFQAWKESQHKTVGSNT